MQELVQTYAVGIWCWNVAQSTKAIRETATSVQVTDSSQQDTALKIVMFSPQIGARKAGVSRSNYIGGEGIWRNQQRPVKCLCSLHVKQSQEQETIKNAAHNTSASDPHKLSSRGAGQFPVNTPDYLALKEPHPMNRAPFYLADEKSVLCSAYITLGALLLGEEPSLMPIVNRELSYFGYLCKGCSVCWPSWLKCNSEVNKET